MGLNLVIGIKIHTERSSPAGVWRNDSDEWLCCGGEATVRMVMNNWNPPVHNQLTMKYDQMGLARSEWSYDIPEPEVAPSDCLPYTNVLDL